MGLDMYLYAEKYISAWDYEVVNGEMQRKDEPLHDLLIKVSDMDTLPSGQYGGVTITKTVGYWRKANAIHGWFVRELADGVDNCERIRVTRDDLKRLRDLCVDELNNRALATPSKKADYVKQLNGDDERAVMDSIIETIKQESDKTMRAQVTDDPLAPTEGFFFGSTEKDEWYYESLEYTIEMINSILAYDSEGNLSYYYEASW